MSIGVFRLDSRVEQGDRSSGTGGFALIGESTHPVVQDLNSEAGREWYGIEPDSVAGVEAVPLRVLEGEDAIAKNREVMGATDPAQAAPGTIRKEFALSKGENSAHGSDSPAAAAREISFFFSGLELVG